MSRPSVHRAIFLGAVGLLAISAAPASADIYGPSNFGSFVYPRHGCGARPIVPDRSSGFRSHFEAQDYNARIEDYNRQIKNWSACISDYIDRAKLDMQRIHEKQLQAAQEAQ